jgi:hypothetical protein
LTANSKLVLDDIDDWSDAEVDEGDWSNAAAASILSRLGFEVVPSSDPAALKAQDIEEDEDDNGGDDDDGELNNNIPPSIVWDDEVAEYLWSHETRVSNAENWPVLHFEKMLHGQTLQEARDCVTFLAQSSAALSIEQNEGSAAIRRSRVVNLSPGGVPGRNYFSGASVQPFVSDHERAATEKLRELVLRSLPLPLQAALDGSAHACEDCSLVLYDQPADFFAEHHDSWWPGSPAHAVQRSFTILVYLFSPTHNLQEGAAKNKVTEGGGTEFTNLRTTDGSPLVLRPPAGDVIMWPNFDRNGNWSSLAFHRAVAVAKRHFDEASGLPPKAVVNLWFKG